MTLTPAYGRDYKSAKAVKEDWDAEKDFVIADMFHPDYGRYINKQQLSGTAMIRYDKQRKLVSVKGGK